MAYKPISDYGIIGNRVSATLVARDGSIDWCCLPRFDSPSIFAAILDHEKGGKFGIEPRSHFESSQFYLNDTNVLQTVFQTETGTVMLTDFMPCYQRVHGRLVQFNEIYRIAECTHGEVSELADENFLSSETREIIISDTGPTVLVGERINATGKERILMAFADNMRWPWRC